METLEQQRELLDRLRVALLSLSEAMERLETSHQQLTSAVLHVESHMAREERFKEQMASPQLSREMDDLARSLARFPLDLGGATLTFLSELRHLQPLLESASNSAASRANRVAPLADRITQVLRQREAVMERIEAAASKRLFELGAAARIEAEEEQGPQFEVAPPSGDIVVAQTCAAIEVEILLDEPNRIMPPLPSSDTPGVFISTSAPPELGVPVHVIAHLPGGHQLRADGFVCWRREGESPEESGFGVEFAAIREHDRLLLLELLSR